MASLTKTTLLAACVLFSSLTSISADTNGCCFDCSTKLKPFPLTVNAENCNQYKEFENCLAKCDPSGNDEGCNFWKEEDFKRQCNGVYGFQKLSGGILAAYVIFLSAYMRHV
ncbi:hypothetical protein DdX_16042 [Ditylenchus destructor]|uniref:Transmembrane protein n=1 Tax=Ditylenchus destructor TaxID=166010 RepID=A0AAD4MTR8_9BILA|nr:hypothetical protein DdX_16042 [Ditylenchus destructor]